MDVDFWYPIGRLGLGGSSRADRREKSQPSAPAIRRRIKDKVRSKENLRRDAISLGLIWLPYTFLVNRFWYVSDDAFIVFRFAQNWVTGHGLRYNLGEHAPAEGYSDFLWVVVCAVFEYFRLDTAFWAPVFSFCCGLLFLGFLYRTLLYRLELDWPVVLFSVLSLACFPPFAVWSTAGLETMPFALALFVTFERMALRPERAAPVSGGLMGLAVSLLRTEGVAWALVVGFVSCVSRRMAGQKCRRPLVIYLAIVIIGFSVYFAWRYSYYQVLFPNPVYVKVKFGPEVLLRGYRYVAFYFLTFLTPFLL